MNTDLFVSPERFSMATTEELPLGFDTTSLLQGDDEPSSPSTTLIDLTNNEEIDLGVDPIVAANIVVQLVQGTLLTAGHKYALSITFTSAANTWWTMVLTIDVPQ